MDRWMDVVLCVNVLRMPLFLSVLLPVVLISAVIITERYFLFLCHAVSCR